jgi:hypothetical protein
MPRIPDWYLDSIIYLYPCETGAKAGKKAGGTGFLVGIVSEELEHWVEMYAVTNHHVIDPTRGDSPVVRINTRDGTHGVLEFDYYDWTPHPDGDDLAVLPLDFEDGAPYLWERFVDHRAFITDELIEIHNIGPGDETYLIGRFVDHQGTVRNLPTARFGTIAMMPGEPVKTQYGPQQAFLVETRSIGGYSGSPVFVHIPAMSLRWKDPATGLAMNAYGPWLLGVDCGHLPYQGDPSDRIIIDFDGYEHPDGWQVRGNSGLSTVIPAQRLAGLLNEEVLVKARAKSVKREKERRAKLPEVVPDSAPPRLTSEDSQKASQRASRKRPSSSKPARASRRTSD